MGYKMARPRYRNKLLTIPTNLRKKCEDTGTVKDVNYRYIQIPPEATSNKKYQDFYDIPGAVVLNYHTHEGAEEAHGEGSFTNNYREEDFLKV